MSLAGSGLDQLLAGVEGLSVAPVSTPAATARGKSTFGGGTAKRLTTLYRSPSEFAESARFATEGADEQECLGLIGSDKRRFCIVRGCDTKHRGGKFEPPSNHLFIKSSSTEAFCKPCVDAVKVPVGEVADLLASTKTVEEWVNVFGVIDSAEDELTLDELEGRLEFLSQARAHRTPTKGTALSDSVFLEEDLENMLEEVPAEVVHATRQEWSTELPYHLLEAMEVMGRTVNGLSAMLPTALSEISVRARNAKEGASEVTDRLNARLIAVESTTGARPEEVDDLPPTLWEGLTSLWTRDSVAGTPSTAASSTESSAGLPKVVKAVAALTQQVGHLDKDVGQVLRGSAEHKKQAARLFGGIMEKLKEVVAAQNDLTDEMARVTTGSTSGPVPAGGLDSLLADLGASPAEESDLEILREEVAALRKAVDDQNEKENDQTVEIAGLRFHKQEDLAAWILENSPDAPWGTIVDFHSLLQQVHSERGGYETTDSILKSLKVQGDMEIDTISDVLALAAIRHGIPEILGEGKPTTGADRSAFNAFPSFSDWKHSNGRDGLVNTIKSDQQRAAAAVLVDIKSRLEAGSPMALLARDCLTKSVAFTNDFISYLTVTYEELVTSSGFPKKRAWALTTALGARVCNEIHQDSSALARSLKVSKDKKARDQLTAKLIWATLREHKRMQEYTDLEFKDHPTIASEYVKFLATNSGYETVAALQSKVDSLEKEVEALKKAVTKAANAADAAKIAATEAKKLASKN